MTEFILIRESIVVYIGYFIAICTAILISRDIFYNTFSRGEKKWKLWRLIIGLTILYNIVFRLSYNMVCYL